MSQPLDVKTGRRELLRFLARSPLLMASGASVGACAGWLQDSAEEASARAPESLASMLESPDQALSVMEFEEVARAILPPAHFGYMASGVDDDATLRANRDDFGRLRIRARRLIDVSRVDTSVEILGRRWPSPIVICPCGSQNAFHADGETATAHAARAQEHLMMLSGVTTTAVEQVNEARGEPVWYQLYPTDDPEVALAVARRAEAAGCPVLVLTVDLNAGRNSETAMRMRRADTRDCSSCHVPERTGLSEVQGMLSRKPMFDGLDLGAVTDYGDDTMTWNTIDRIRDAVPSMKVVLKGIVTAEDAMLAIERGIDAIVVSNHGGRAEESGRSTIDCLPEVATAVAGRLPILLDGGIRRGTDIFKAIALGATAVGIGRPYLWGLAAFGQPGVEAVLTILRAELELIMRQAGTTSLDAIGPSTLVLPRA